MKSTLEKEKTYMTVEDACEYLGITRRNLDSLTGHKRITYVLCGGRKFRKEWLDEFMEKNKVVAVN